MLRDRVNMDRLSQIVFLVALSLCSVNSNPLEEPKFFLRNSSTTVTKTELINYLSRISGSFTISGQHNREPNSDPARWSNIVRDITGKYPGLWGGDFLFLPDDVRNRQPMITEAIRQWNAGSVVALTWHVCPPTVGETCNWDQDGILSWLNDNQWNDLVNNGGDLNNRWKARLDTIVPFLWQLDNAGVIAIWRPIHEMNEGWSWWGGRSGPNGSRRLYEITYDYLVQYHGLNNLVWTWCVKDVDMGAISGYWPSSETVDVASLDLWMNLQPRDDHYQQMLDVAGGKPIALAEVGSVPTPEVLARQPGWIWFMVWAEYLRDPAYNTDQNVRNTYYNARVLSQGNIEINPPGSENIALNRPVSASSEESEILRAENAVDGDMNTRWSSSLTDQQWIYVDLGYTRNIRQVRVAWEIAYARAYQIQTSVDDATWTTVYEDYNANGGVHTINLEQTSTRYVKVYMFQRGTEYGYSIHEIEVYA